MTMTTVFEEVSLDTREKPLTGRVALVTGSSRGIGSSIAAELARAGAHTVVNYCNGRQAAASVVESIIEEGGSASAEACDVSNAKEVEQMLERVGAQFGRLDILVNNAGILRDRSFKKMTLTDWHEVIHTNLTSVMNCCHFAIPLMLENDWGRVVNISSFVGQMGNFGQANYSAAKAGIIGFTKTLAIELAANNVTVNAVCPGFVETEMWQSVPPNVQEKILSRVPMRRVAQPREIARGVRFLCTDGDYITGQTLNINGGIYMA
jgi:acetoacetyl-CoA reductase